MVVGAAAARGKSAEQCGDAEHSQLISVLQRELAPLCTAAALPRTQPLCVKAQQRGAAKLGREAIARALKEGDAAVRDEHGGNERTGASRQ